MEICAKACYNPGGAAQFFKARHNFTKDCICCLYIVYIYIYIYIYVYTYTCMSIYMSMHIYIYIYIYVYRHWPKWKETTGAGRMAGHRRIHELSTVARMRANWPPRILSHVCNTTCS